jgi:hypothetical protein
MPTLQDASKVLYVIAPRMLSRINYTMVWVDSGVSPHNFLQSGERFLQEAARRAM